MSGGPRRRRGGARAAPAPGTPAPDVIPSAIQIKRLGVPRMYEIYCTVSFVSSCVVIFFVCGKPPSIETRRRGGARGATPDTPARQPTHPTSTPDQPTNTPDLPTERSRAGNCWEKRAFVADRTRLAGPCVGRGAHLADLVGDDRAVLLLR